MRKQYDFSKAIRNPYAKRLERQVTVRLDPRTIEYFQQLSQEVELPYKTLIELCLRDCALSGRRLRLDWKPRAKRGAE